jgi:hypothetical protein
VVENMLCLQSVFYNSTSRVPGAIRLTEGINQFLEMCFRKVTFDSPDLDFMKTIISILLPFLFLSSYGQNISKSPVMAKPEFSFAEIAWHDSDITCIVTDQGGINGDIRHTVHLFTANGHPFNEEAKVTTRHSLQHEMNFTLNKTLFFLKTHRNETARVRLQALTIEYKERGIREGKFDIFSIDKEEENKKLRSELYKFNAYEGLHKKQQLITYNNDYKEEFPEGFMYRTVDQYQQFSELRTLQLPYPDPQCNIRTVLYDDQSEQLYILCDLFEVKGNNRTFKHHFLYKHDIASGKGSILRDEMRGFEEKRLVTFLDSSEIIFGGIEIPGRKSKAIEYSLLRLSRFDGSTIGQQQGALSTALTQEFMSVYNSRSSEMLRPLKILKDENGRIHFFWKYAATIDDVAGEDRNPVFIPVTGSFIATAIVFSLNIADGSLNHDMSTALVWLSMKDDQIREHVLIDSLKTSDLNTHGFYPLLLNNQARVMYNRPTEPTLTFIQPALLFETENGTERDNTFKNTLKELQINTVFGMSHFSEGGDEYFLSGYNPMSDPYETDARKRVELMLMTIHNRD